MIFILTEGLPLLERRCSCSGVALQSTCLRLTNYPDCSKARFDGCWSL